MLNNQADIFTYYRALQQQVRGDILRESEEQIVGTDTEELAKFFFDKYALPLIEEDSQREATWDIQDYLKTIPAHERDSFYSQEGDLRDLQCQKIAVEVPIIPNKHLQVIARLRSSTFSYSYSDEDLYWDTDKIVSTIETKGYGFEYNETEISREVQQTLSRIREVIRWKNSDIEQGNRELLANIKNIIFERKQKIAQNKERLEALTKIINIPLRKKDSASAVGVTITRAPLIQRIKPKPSLPEDYRIDEDRVNDIITFVDNQAQTYERAPKAVKELGEENLRDLLLASLNSVFEGNATGETFSKNGKTDIYLKIAKGNILICECKIWGGKSLYSETIDQLRGYLTWRHNYGILITFVRIKDFSKTLHESEGTVQAHPSYINGFRKLSETHFVSNHKVDDEEKAVKIHHLFYHLYSK